MKKCVVALAVLASISGPVLAQSFDARKDAMGGVGVASARYGSAAPVNPALLAKYNEGDDFSIVLPSVGAQVADKDDLIDGFDAIKGAYDAFIAAGDSASADQLHNDLQAVDGKSALANVGVNLQIAIPNSMVSMGFMANGYAVGLVRPDVAQSDLDYLQGVSDGSIAADPSRALDSQAVGVVAIVQDYGVALAHKFDVQGMPLYVGVTPKAQKVDTYNYVMDINNYDTSDLNDDKFRSGESGFNTDIGVALDAGGMTYGLAVRDLVSRDIKTKAVAGRTFTYQIAPVATIAAAYRGDWVTAAVDLDVNKTKGWEGLEGSQYIGAGVEFDAASWAQLRAGIRADLAGEQPDLLTAGVGLSPFDVFHLDLAGQVGSDKAVGAVLSMSYTF